MIDANFTGREQVEHTVVPLDGVAEEWILPGGTIGAEAKSHR